MFPRKHVSFNFKLKTFVEDFTKITTIKMV